MSLKSILSGHHLRVLYTRVGPVKLRNHRTPPHPYGSLDNTWDDFGYMGCPTDVDRVKLIKRLIEEGYEDKIVVGHDSAYKIQKLAYGGPGLGHILNNVPTLFKRLEVDQKYFNKIMVDNPQKLFG